MVDVEEDYNVDAYDDDLFGADNDDYNDCSAFSTLAPPGLPFNSIRLPVSLSSLSVFLLVFVFIVLPTWRFGRAIMDGMI